MTFSFFLFLLLLINSEESSIESEYTCEESQISILSSYDDNCFQTPPKEDLLGNYKSSYQDMNYITGYAQLKYLENQKKCQINFITKINPILGIRNIDYKIIYLFNNIEQENNYFIAASDKSYIEGISVSAKILNLSTQKIIATLNLEPQYLIWDNININYKSEYEEGTKGVIVELFGWPYEDISEECDFLSTAGYVGVKISPPNEGILSNNYDFLENDELNPWWYSYEPVSYKLNSRMGNRTQLKKMINKCHEKNILIHADIVLNNMVTNDYDFKTGNDGSPYYTIKGKDGNNYYTNKLPVFEFPAVPYCASDFHCIRHITNINNIDELNIGWVDNKIDLNTDKEYVQQRIADFITDLISIGISGVFIDNAINISPDNFVNIFLKLKENLGFFPQEFIAVLKFKFGEYKNIIFCNDREYYSFGDSLSDKLKDKGFSDEDINKIKFWNSDYPSSLPICNNEWKISPERYITSLENIETISQNYLQYKNITIHRLNIINHLKSSSYPWKLKTILSAYSPIDSSVGIPDGISDCEKSKIKNCKKSVPYSKAYAPLSKGYDTGDIENWKEGKYTRVHRDLNIVNAMREWMGLNYINEEELYAKEIEKSLNCGNEKPFYIVEGGACAKDCSFNDFKNNYCIIKNETDYESKDKLIQSVKNQIIEGKIDNILNTVLYDEKNDIIINNSGFNIMLTSSYNQKNNIYDAYASIDLDECENILRKENDIFDNETLLIFKYEYYKKGYLIPIVEYEVLHPRTKDSLDLTKCNKIGLTIPVNINENNLFKYIDKNDFYNDKCYPYTSENGNDIILEDRQKKFRDMHLSLCEKNCEYFWYNNLEKLVYCDCSPKSHLNSISDIEKNNHLLSENFSSSKSNTNLYLFKCIMTFFTKKGFVNNLGNIIFLIIILLYIASINYLSIIGFKLYKRSIKRLLNSQKENIIKKINDINKDGINKKKIMIKKIPLTTKKSDLRHDTNDSNNKTLNSNNKNRNNKPDQKLISINVDNDSKILDITNKSLTNLNKAKTAKINDNKNINELKEEKNKQNNEEKNIINISNVDDKLNNKNKRAVTIKTVSITNIRQRTNNNISIYSEKDIIKKDLMEKGILNNNNQLKNVTDYELNTFPFLISFKFDKRGFLEIYISLLKINHIIFSTFFNSSDYNNFIIKLCLFFLTFSLLFAINTFFLTEKIIQKIYEIDEYNIKYNFPKIVYSTAISTVIIYIIRYFSLSEKNIVEIKYENSDVLKEKINDVFHFLLKKFSIFFDVCLIILIIFWYYVSCFCAVYVNSQIYLLLDVLISLLLFIVYQFIIYIVPTIFRYFSLKNVGKNYKSKQKIFKIGKFLEIL